MRFRKISSLILAASIGAGIATIATPMGLNVGNDSPTISIAPRVQSDRFGKYVNVNGVKYYRDVIVCAKGFRPADDITPDGVRWAGCM